MFTPTEASAFGAIGAAIVGGITGLTRSGFARSLSEAALSTGAIMFLLIAAQMFSRMLAFSGVVNWLGQAVESLTTSTLGTVALLIAVLLVLGMVLDSSSIILLTLPFMFPVVLTLGLDPVWFGIVMVVAVEVGILTPPFGMVPFAMSGVLGPETDAQEIFRGAVPFVVIMILTMGLLIVFPSLVTWLPSKG